MTSTPKTAAETFAPNLFEGRTVLVTGGGRGIGRSTALGFATLGASVAIAARDAENLEKTLSWRGMETGCSGWENLISGYLETAKKSQS